MYDHTLHLGRNNFCCYCPKGFITEEILKCHIKNCYKINGKILNTLNSKVLKER